MPVNGRANLWNRAGSRQGRRAAALLLWLLLAACAGAADAPPVEVPAPDSAAAPPPPGAGRPETVEGVISLEGSRQPMTYRLYRSPDGFPLPFSTYLPADVRAEEVSSEGARAVRFGADFGGSLDGQMYVRVEVPQERLGTQRARERARGMAEAMGTAGPGEDGRYPWALEWYRVGGRGDRFATVALGRHRERYFFVVTHWPAEAAEGFGARARRVMEEWRWGEGGALGS